MNRKRRHHGGFTIVELLVASTVGLLLVLGVIEAFRQITHAVNKGRANVQLSGKLRNTINLLREDFQGITVPAIPNISTNSGAGYFEIIEGEDNDLIQSPTDTLSGDTDDVIMFTSRRLGVPFSGRVNWKVMHHGNPGLDKTITSPNAEIIYWLEPRNTEFLKDGIDNNGNGTLDEPSEGLIAPILHNGMPLATLRRRALLIRPDLNVNGVIPGYTANQIRRFLNENDVSVRVNPDGTLSANTLSDLSLRQNRVAHIPSAGPTIYGSNIKTRIDKNFPYRFDPTRLPFQWDYKHKFEVDVYSLGEDIVLDQVIGFDIRVYDPHAKIVSYLELPTNTPETPVQKQAREQEQEPLVPGDPGYIVNSNTDDLIGTGAYIDLGFASSLTYLPKNVGSELSYRADTRAQLNRFDTPSLFPNTFGYFKFGDCRVYDTWTIEYERDGINQNYPRNAPTVGAGENWFIDEGFNGLDDNRSDNAGIDDATEREAPPPYSAPLRGFQVIVRAFQSGQQQTRQFTITHDFTPE
ncbi:MAG: prepilin-type N-terminal cleavage/methylation domain-containing protein [Planctomycetaceae bacterium]|jgi:hypothetical protein|nr:prepilin-type N-terminal cleavage/methylation domain-containing protein [Planctomycetaceae bacterium]MBT4724895.1 prepilin-type N-terminal cleavage/methylation domain-containing protein [Planctomycetaceae bacterium]MBT4847253.1 prepilin-type N-terminal cleavage/methylation domain-containing protein [Planctomycetaceae bacterium]MBT5123450.1 prepilin-type N-terminal cleavage/methylation domain-containing protein [Planctomycetaceae bacterium]MBT5599209.1 prepilin-type N-terminal cleavage/methyl